MSNKQIATNSVWTYFLSSRNCENKNNNHPYHTSTQPQKIQITIEIYIDRTTNLNDKTWKNRKKKRRNYESSKTTSHIITNWHICNINITRVRLLCNLFAKLKLNHSHNHHHNKYNSCNLNSNHKQINKCKPQYNTIHKIIQTNVKYQYLSIYRIITYN